MLAHLMNYSLGNLGALYQSERRKNEALLLTRRAVRAAEAAESAESLDTREKLQ